MPSNTIPGFSVVALVWMVVAVPLCQAQYPDDSHPLVLDGGAGIASVRGADGRNFGSFTSYQAGLGVNLKAIFPGLFDHNDQSSSSSSDSPAPTHGWNFFAKGEFLYGQPDLKANAIAPIIIANPQTPALLSATGGSGKFYSATLGPRVQHSWKWVSLYGQAGFGWMRRSIVLTGTSTEGTVLQPNNPSVFVQSGNSGAFRGSFGFAAGGKGVRGFVEIGLLQGFAINHGTLLAPILSGGVRW